MMILHFQWELGKVAYVAFHNHYTIADMRYTYIKLQFASNETLHVYFNL